MFKINDGREHFYQWDLNRKIEVKDASIKEVHFCNRTDDCSLVVEVVDGVANVPNILLQDNFRINVYGYDGEATKHSDTLNEHLIHCVATGKTPGELKKLLQEDFGVSYGRADSLVRTELAHIQTQAA